MTTASLFDDAARRAIATDLDDNLFVEAGAGTGKTSALVSRVVALVQRGTPIARIAAITFTEAAAAELRERVREALGEAVRGGGSAGAACAAALARFDDATISTLHAFAQTILAEFPVEAGLPPGFEVLDEIQASIDFTQRWDGFVDAVTADPAYHRALTVVGALGFRMDRLAELARLVHADWDRLDATSTISTTGSASATRSASATARASEAASTAPRGIPPLDLAPALAALDAATAYVDGCIEPSDKLFCHLHDKVIPLYDALRAAPDEAAALDVLAARPTVTFSHGQKRNWPDKSAVLAALDTADAALEAQILELVGPSIRMLLDAVVGFVRASVDERRRAGRLEFHDLLVLARDLVRRDAGVRAALHDRYQHLLLDEFQDTDPLQIELAALIATDDAEVATKPWFDCHIPPGRLFVVGDPKQSIYRFRRADIELYHQVRDVLGTRVTLTTNFRSRPGVIEFVNRVFAALLAPGNDPLQAAYEALLPSRDDGGPSITVLGTGQPKDADLAELRRREAQDLAAMIRRIRDDAWPVARPGPDGTEDIGPARYADIAVLLPTRAALPYLEQALDDARIPARIESQSLVYATAEVQELLVILMAIDDPADEVALVAALRAPGFACRDDRLLEFHQAGGRWDYRAPAPPTLPPTHPVVAAMETLRALHEQRWWDTVSETVERVIRERRLMELAVARPRPRDHWRRIRFVADAARAFADGGGTSLRGFVQWLARQVDEEARAVEVVVPEPDDDAVRILTIHGAKGLEFPVVVLAGLGVADRQASPPVLWSADGVPEFRIGPRKRDGAKFRYMTPGYEARADHERAAETAEQVRLLYVGATRARDHLIVSLHHRVNDVSHASLLWPPVDAARDCWVAAESFEPPDVVDDTPIVGHGSDGDDGRVWAESRARQIAAGRRRPVAAATALAHAATEASDDELVGIDAELDRPAYRRGRAGTAIGRAVHAVLQTVDLATGAGLDATARAQALAEGVPEREAEIRELAASALQAPVMRRVVDAAWPRWREVPVAAVVDGVLVEGFIDLLVETPHGLLVVDYKTDAAPSDVDLDSAVRRYEVQAGAYAMALEAALGRPVRECVFVFAGERGARERAVPDLADAMRRARTVLPAVAGAGG